MTNGTFKDIEQLESDLWEAADNLRANSKLTSSDYFMPVLGVIFLRHAANRFEAAGRQIAADQASGRMPRRRLLPEDYIRRRAPYLPERARFNWIMQQAALGGTALPKLVNDAMTAIEDSFAPLAGVLPRDYGIFETRVLEDLMRVFNSERIRAATGDVFGRIYEYFLAKFSVQKAHDNGEFFTPSALVQTIVNVIEPDHGVVFDPACGSGGMFVQSSHFIEHEGGDARKKVLFYGQEKNPTTIRIATMNLAVHGLEGRIAEAITYYQDEFTVFGQCDFVMANPPFNVDLVDAERIAGDPRLPFGLPGVNKQKKVGNGNYLWISYFWSYLNARGRAGFVMSSQASSAGHGEKEVRRKLIETGDLDLMISIRANFFYTRTVPCELWFLDRGKPAARRDRVLMLDARNVYRKVTRKIYDFSPEQMQNLAAIVWLYRGQRQEGHVPIVSSSGITGRHTESKAKPPGVVTGRYGTIGEVFYIEEDYWPLNTALYVTDFKGNPPRFVAYLLRNVLGNYQSDKAAVPGVNRNVLHALKVRCPDPDVQTRIADILGAYDELIANNRRRMALLEDAARQLYNEWFVRLRFPGYEHTPITNGVPEGWEMRPLGRCARFLSGGTPSKARSEFWEGDIPWASSRELTTMRISDTTLHVTPEAIDAGSRLVPAETILAVVRGMSLANEFRISIAAQPMSFNQDLKAIIPGTDVDPLYLFHALETQRNEIRDKAGEASHGTKKLDTLVLAEIKILVPPQRFQRLFLEMTAPQHALWDLLDRQIRNLRAARDLLLPRLMSGELAV